MPLEFARGVISFDPQPTARNFNRPARMLRLGPSSPKDRNQSLSNTGSDFLPWLFPLRPLCLCGETHPPSPYALPRVKALGARDEPFRRDRRSVRCLSSNGLWGIKWLEAYPECLRYARSLHFADDKKSEFPRIGIYAGESFRAECPRFALEGTSETRCFAIGFCKSTKQRQPSNARSAKRAVPY